MADGLLFLYLSRMQTNTMPDSISLSLVKGDLVEHILLKKNYLNTNHLLNASHTHMTVSFMSELHFIGWVYRIFQTKKTIWKLNRRLRCVVDTQKIPLV